MLLFESARFIWKRSDRHVREKSEGRIALMSGA